jgi:hypothetical protein
MTTFDKHGNVTSHYFAPAVMPVHMRVYVVHPPDCPAWERKECACGFFEWRDHGAGKGLERKMVFEGRQPMAAFHAVWQAEWSRRNHGAPWPGDAPDRR